MLFLPFDEALEIAKKFCAAVAAREEQIKKLERLVWDAIYALQKAGFDSEAARLRRVLTKS